VLLLIYCLHSWGRDAARNRYTSNLHTKISEDFYTHANRNPHTISDEDAQLETRDIRTSSTTDMDSCGASRRTSLQWPGPRRRVVVEQPVYQPPHNPC
jgi:hypothetical protein